MKPLAAIFLVYFLASCGGSQPVPDIADAAYLDPYELYPLAIGNTWNYNVDTGDDVPPTLANIKVVAIEGNTYLVATASKVRHYQVTDEGIRIGERDEWLIKTPVRVGATWPSLRGKEATVISISETARVAGRSVDRCVVVKEQDLQKTMTVHTTYCAGIGPVSVDVRARSPQLGREIKTSSILLGCAISQTGTSRASGVCVEQEIDDPHSVSADGTFSGYAARGRLIGPWRF